MGWAEEMRSQNSVLTMRFCAYKADVNRAGVGSQNTLRRTMPEAQAVGIRKIMRK